MSELDVVTVEYEFLPVVNGYVDAKSAEQLDKLLTINDDKSIIYICNPKYIFNNLVSNKDTGEVLCVEWDNIDELKMLNSKNNYRYSIIDQRYSLGNMGRDYIEKQGSIMKQISVSQGKSDFACSYAIVEEINDRFSPKSYFVRGIICVNQDSYQIAFNPQLIKNMEEKKNHQKRINFIDGCKNKGFI